MRVLIGQNGQAIQIENLFIKFEVVKEAVRTPGEGFIKIYNLNENNETRIKEQFEQVRLLAGYDDNIGIIFNGDGRNVERDRQGLDRVSNVTLGGNVQRITRARVDRSYEGQVTVRQIIQDALPSFNLDFDSLDVIPLNATQQDFAFSGRTSDMFKMLLTPLNINFFESDGSISFSVRGEPRQNVNAFLVSQNTGMVGTPSITDNGIKVTTLLNAQLNLNDPIRVVSEVLQRAPSGDAQNAKASEQQGFYKITKLVHRGDNREGEFVTEIQAKPI